MGNSHDGDCVKGMNQSGQQMYEMFAVGTSSFQ